MMKSRGGYPNSRHPPPSLLRVCVNKGLKKTFYIFMEMKYISQPMKLSHTERYPAEPEDVRPVIIG